MERPAIRLSGPCVEAPDVPALVRFYERFLGWEVEELVGPRDDRPPGWGWGRRRPADKAEGQKIEVQWQEHYQRPVYPGEPGKPTMQGHLDWWVEDLEAGVAWALDCGAVEASPQPSNRPPPGAAPCSTRPATPSASGPRPFGAHAGHPGATAVGLRPPSSS